MSQWMAIVNPRSGGLYRRAHLYLALKCLNQFVQRIVITEYRGHACKLAMNAARFGGVVSVGGDGTLFEILQGLDRKTQRVAIVAAGRGNSMARHLGLVHARMNFEVIHSKDAVPVDLLEVVFRNSSGDAEKRVSASTIAVGYPAAVAQVARRFYWLGPYAYLAATATVCPVPFCGEISLENGHTNLKRCRGIIVNNTRYIGNFLAFPQACCSDGFFEVMELRAGYFKQSLHNCSAVSGWQFYDPSPVVRARSAEIHLDSPQPLLIDGELFADVVFASVRVLPSEFLCNQRNSTA